MDRAVKLSMDLIGFKSITPKDDGIMQFIAEKLAGIGFENDIKSFHKNQEGSESTLNLYSSVGASELSGKNLCFAGHVDVVHPGKEYKWTYNPFEPVIDNGILYGRGASDMKCAIAAFIVACERFLIDNPSFMNSGNQISLLLTGDEEGNAINGTKPMLEHLANNDVKITDCIVGEPTNPAILGEMIKIGRRGSISFELEIEGKQGHIAYPENFINPITILAKCILALKEYKFDEGNEFFQPSNLEVTILECDNKTINLVPNSALCKFNIRFSSEQTKDSLIASVHKIIQSSVQGLNFTLKHFYSGDAFLNQNKTLVDIFSAAVTDITNITPVLSTSGGTSDARFIKDYANVIEFGLINKTAHQIDENAKVQDIINLSAIYLRFLERYFT